MWMQTFFMALTSTSTRRRPIRRTASRLCLEPLDDRIVPAFLAPVNYPVEWSSEAMVSADFNRDSRLDLASTGGILLGNGDGAFQPARSLPPVGGPWVMAVGDFNRDGNPDLAGPTSVMLGNGDGTFGQPREFGGWAYELAVGDLNGDGDADLVTTSWVSNDESGVSFISVLLGNGDGTFASSPWWGETTGLSIALADFNNDGMLDVATTHYRNVAMWLGNGDGTFRPFVSYADAPADHVAVADFNGDSQPDLLTYGNDSYNNYVSVLVGNGDGTFQPARMYQNYYGTVLADFNGDGKTDLAATGGGSVRVFPGNGDGTLGLPTDFHNGFTATRAMAADFNGDGFSDLAGTAGLAVQVLVNDANWPPVGIPSMSVSDTAVTEGNSGTRAASFTVSLSAIYGDPVTVAYATANNTATVGTDYAASSGTLTFAPGETSKTITVGVYGDRLAEPNETFFVNLSSATNAAIADGQGAGSILDDEPRISISDVTKAEGKRGQTTLFTFTVTLSAAYDQAVTMSYATANGTAKTSDNDYIAKTGTLTFNPGETTKTITIVVNGDSKKEANETFYLDLFGNSSNSLFTKNRGLGTILNDD